MKAGSAVRSGARSPSEPAARATCRPGPTRSTRSAPGAGAGLGDAGVASVLVLSLACVLVLVAALLSSLAAVAVARQRAAGIADLAALAGAARALDGQDAACARAGQVALLGGGRLVECSLDGARVDVRAEVRPQGALAALGVASARASAGPVDGLPTSAAAPPD